MKNNKHKIYSRVVLVFIMFCCFMQNIKAQEVTSLYTLLTTDKMSGEERVSFNWHSMSLIPLHNNMLARTNNCIWSVQGFNTTVENRLCYFWVSSCSGIDPILIYCGNIGEPIPNQGPSDKADELDTDDNTGNGGGNDIDPWNPPPPPPADQGGGGTLNPNDPHGTPPKDPDKDPKNPGKPSTGFEDDQPKQTITPPPPPKETTKKPCPDTTGTPKRAEYLHTVMNYIDTTKEMKKLRDSCLSYTKEAGFIIRQQGANAATAKYVPEGYKDSSQAQSVDLGCSTSTACDIHLHPFKTPWGVTNIISPSATDFYGLLYRNTDTAIAKHKFMARLTIYGDSARQQFAIIVTDTNATKTYYAQYPPETILDTAQTINGKPNPYANNWKGNVDSINTNLGKFQDAITQFKKEGYPKRMWNTYANVYMMSQKVLNMPIKMYRRDEYGDFKELNFEETETTNPDGTKTKHFTITECL